MVLHPEAEITADYGSGLTLACVGFGSPLPDVVWMRDGTTIDNSTINANIFEMSVTQNSTSFRQSILELCPLQDSGNYSCQAINAINTHSAFFQITVTIGKFNRWDIL